MTPFGLRLRQGLDRWAPVVVLAFLVVAAVGGWQVYAAYLAHPTHQEQRTVDEWGLTGSFTHGAIVSEAAAGTVFVPGTVVSNRSVYFQRAMPELDGTFRLDYTGSDAPLTVSIDRTLVIESVEAGTSGGQRTVYWHEERPLGTNETTIGPGGDVSVPFAVNVTRTVDEARAMNQQLGAPGRIDVRVHTAVVATREADGATVRRAHFDLPIQVSSSLYRVQADPHTETYSRTETVTVPTQPSPLQRAGGPLVGVLGLLGAGGIAFAHRRGSILPTEDERRWLVYRRERTDFDEWITTARLPETLASRPKATVDSLADLVDFAISTQGAVLESPDGDVYTVLHDGVRYTFEAPSDPKESAKSRSGDRDEREDVRDPLDATADPLD